MNYDGGINCCNDVLVKSKYTTTTNNSKTSIVSKFPGTPAQRHDKPELSMILMLSEIITN